MTSPVQYHYGKFPPKNIDWLRLIPLIGPANAALARYDGTLAAIPNPSILDGGSNPLIFSIYFDIMFSHHETIYRNKMSALRH